MTKHETPFAGFSAGPQRPIALPAQFFSELLAQIDDLDELKLTLACFRMLHQKEGALRYLRHADLHSEAARLNIDLETALARAVARGTLLAAQVPVAGASPEDEDAEQETLYFMNTARGRSAVERIQAGRWQRLPGLEVEVLPERPSLYTLYEENIGPLTAHLAEELKDAEASYVYEWIADAIRLAVEHNKRSWAYVRAILRRWQEEGRVNDGASGRSRKSQSEGFELDNRYRDFIES